METKCLIYRIGAKVPSFDISIFSKCPFSQMEGHEDDKKEERSREIRRRLWKRKKATVCSYDGSTVLAHNV